MDLVEDNIIIVKKGHYMHKEKYIIWKRKKKGLILKWRMIIRNSSIVSQSLISNRLKVHNPIVLKFFY